MLCSFQNLLQQLICLVIEKCLVKYIIYIHMHSHFILLNFNSFEKNLCTLYAYILIENELKKWRLIIHTCQIMRVALKVMPPIYFHGNYNRYKEHTIIFQLQNTLCMFFFFFLFLVVVFFFFFLFFFVITIGCTFSSSEQDPSWCFHKDLLHFFIVVIF